MRLVHVMYVTILYHLHDLCVYIPIGLTGEGGTGSSIQPPDQPPGGSSGRVGHALALVYWLLMPFDL